jgi:hypothetical protein
LLAALPLSSQNWQTYDNFKGPRIDPDRWVCGENNRLSLEFERRIINGWLQLRTFSYGQPIYDGGFNWVTNRLEVPSGKEPEGIVGIRAKVMVTRAMGNSCSSDSIGGTGQVQLGATFFNTGTGLQADDISAELYMYSGVRGIPNTLYVYGRVMNGSGSGDLGSVFLGEVKVGETVWIWLRWDRQAQQIYFGLRRLQQKQLWQELPIAYSFIDIVPPFYVYRSVGMVTQPDNCTSALVYSDMAVKIDQVDVLR